MTGPVIPDHRGQQARHFPDPKVKEGRPYGPQEDAQRCPCGTALRLVNRRWVVDSRPPDSFKES